MKTYEELQKQMKTCLKIFKSKCAKTKIKHIYTYVYV